MGLKEGSIREVYYEIWEIDEEASMNRVTRSRDDYLVDREIGLVVGRVLAIQMRAR